MLKANLSRIDELDMAVAAIETQLGSGLAPPSDGQPSC